MDANEKRRLRRRGWKVVTTAECLGMSKADERYMDARINLSIAMTKERRRRRWTQTQLARKAGVRVEEIRGIDLPSIDVMLRCLFAMGWNRKQVADEVGRPIYTIGEKRPSL